ncbi:MAG TPA: ComEC/Rec2 family competence protein, partial [Lunatimonas sp.]|nr:ComEC/Rec2 family competence protein [Lunatimonas sp.]
DPFIVFSVGFQLSYLALRGILLFQPVIVSWWTPKSKVVDYIWQITSVGMAAQLATFPLSVHYFHVFPTYFMLANVVAIPGAFVIMACGVPFLILSLIEPVAAILGTVLSHLISWVNTVIFSVQYLPFSKMENLSFQWAEMLMTWGFICCIYLLIQSRNKKVAHICITFALLLVGMRWWDFYLKQNATELVFYSVGEGKAVDYFFKGQLYSLTEGVSESDVSYKISPNRIQHGITRAKPMAWKQVDDELYVFLPNKGVVRVPTQPTELAVAKE